MGYETVTDHKNDFHGRHSSMDSSIQLSHSYHHANNPLYPQQPVAYTPHSQYSQYYAVPIHSPFIYSGHTSHHQRLQSASLHLPSPHHNVQYAPITPMAHSPHHLNVKDNDAVIYELPAIPGSVMNHCIKDKTEHSDAMSDVDDVFDTHKTLLHPNDVVLDEMNGSVLSYITDTSAVKQYKSDKLRIPMI